MGVIWINKTEELGSATLTSSYVVINQLFADKFANSFSALVGLDDSNNLLFKPLTLDESESSKYKNSLQVKIKTLKSFIRLGNTANMKAISDLLKIDLSKSGTKFVTHWDEKENALVIQTGGE